MTAHQAFTITDVRVFDGRRVVDATHVRVAGGRVDALGTPRSSAPETHWSTGAAARCYPGSSTRTST